MKRIIGGKKYDTETAEEVAEVTHGNRRQFEYYEETLYRKRTGEYFLYGYGYAASRYAKQVCGDFVPGGDIIPLTFEQARSWAERELSADEYESIFGEVPEGDEEADVVLSVRVSPATRERLRRMAAESGRSQGAVLDELVSRAQGGAEE